MCFSTRGGTRGCFTASLGRLLGACGLGTVVTERGRGRKTRWWLASMLGGSNVDLRVLNILKAPFHAQSCFWEVRGG